MQNIKLTRSCQYHHDTILAHCDEDLAGIYYVVMATSERPRSIRFPQWLWDEIDRDAQRCKRSSVKQMEAILAAYYRGEVEEIDQSQLQTLRRSRVLEKK